MAPDGYAQLHENTSAPLPRPHLAPYFFIGLDVNLLRLTSFKNGLKIRQIWELQFGQSVGGNCSGKDKSGFG
jgi:hypothetical protein